MRTLRAIGVGWWLQLKMRSRSAFDGILGVLWPMFFGLTALLMVKAGQPGTDLLSTAVGASVLGVWSSAATSGAAILQHERRQGTLELLAAAPLRFALTIVPMPLALATLGLVSMVTTLLFGWLVLGIELQAAQPAALVVAVAATVVSIGMLAYVMAMTAVRYRTAWALGNTLEIPVWLICGFLVPLSLLPDWVRPISWVLAPTWGVEAVRRAALGGSPWWPILGCLALAAGYGAIGAFLAGRLLDSARRHATLALS